MNSLKPAPCPFRCGTAFGSSLALAAALLLVQSAPRAADFQPLKGEPGVSYRHDTIAKEPWSIHVLQVERSRQDLGIYSTHAKGRVLGVSLLSEQARSVPGDIGRAIAAVNGDFYLRDNTTFAGDPRGLQIVNGELISGPDTVCIWFGADGAPHLDEVKGEFNVTWPDGSTVALGLNQQSLPTKAVLYTPTYGATTRAAAAQEIVLEKEGDSPWLPLRAGQAYRGRVREVRAAGNTRLEPGVMVLSLSARMLSGGRPEIKVGDVLKISTATVPDLKGAKAAMGGGPALVQQGKSVFTAQNPPPGASDWSQRSKYERHPRAAVGWSATHYYFVIVDGRQPGLSVGMKLAELSDYMVGLGCTEAMNLDGGKSAQMWVKGEIKNSPCQGEDTVANSLIVVRKP